MAWGRIIAVSVLAGLVSVACVEKETAEPTQADIKKIKENVLTKAPAMKFKVDADLEGRVTYLGMDVDTDPIKPGVPFKLTHYWKVNKTVTGWKIFVHLNDPDKKSFVNADHGPIGGRYAATKWKKGEIIRDQHTVTLPGNWTAPKVSVFTGLWQGKLRMKPKKNGDADNRVIAATLNVEVPEAAAGGAADENRQIVAKKIAAAIKIDGKLDEEAWAGAPSTGAFVDTMSGGAAPIKTEAKVLWDDKNLYVAFVNEDTNIWGSLKKRDDKLWTEEAVELFIDANGDGKDYIELQVNPHGAIFDSYLPEYRKNDNKWNSKMTAAVTVDGTLDKQDDEDKSWTVEIAIPWADVKGKGDYELRLPPAPGDTWRINMFRLDKPGKDKPQLAAAWRAPMVGDFHKLDRFGTLLFGDENAAAPPVKAEATEPAGKPTKSAGGPQVKKHYAGPIVADEHQARRLARPAALRAIGKTRQPPSR